MTRVTPSLQQAEPDRSWPTGWATRLSPGGGKWWHRLVRLGLCGAGVLSLALATGFFLRLPWAVRTWPWAGGYDDPLSYVFVAAILAAIGAAVLWIGVSGEYGSIPAGALNLTVMLGGISIFLAGATHAPGPGSLMPYAIGAGIVAFGNLLLFLWTRRLPVYRPQPLPKLMRLSYAAFAVVLLGVGVALLVGVPQVLPWPVGPETAVVYGWVFFGDAWYFLFAVVRPYWQCARAQLWSFLAYDLVLIGPLLGRISDVQPDLLPSLLVYLAVLVYSGGLAIYYLFLNRSTRVAARHFRRTG
jgi:hypothetical protein